MSQTGATASPRPLVIEAALPVDVDLPVLSEAAGPAIAYLDADGTSDLLVLRHVIDDAQHRILVPESQRLRVEHSLNISRGVATERMFRLTYGLYAPDAPVLPAGVKRALLLTRHLLVPALIQDGTFIPVEASQIHRAKTAKIPDGPVVALFDRLGAAPCQSAHRKMLRAEMLRSEIDLVFDALDVPNTEGVAFC